MTDDEQEKQHAKWKAAYAESGCNGDRDKLAYWLIDQKEKLEAENAELRETIDRVRAIGTVYQYPGDWNCMKMGGHPPIDAYERVDLSDV